MNGSCKLEEDRSLQLEKKERDHPSESNVWGKKIRFKGSVRDEGGKFYKENVYMSRGKVRTAAEVCADCSAPDPIWASVNRGVLICHECCSVHRSLGRHISQVKHLKKAQWTPSRLTMVHQLYSSGANNIWEHSLLDPSQNKHCKKKPQPHDPVHPNKDHYIRTKYQFLSFVNQGKDGDVSTVEDLSKQLHSSVRTSNLETCLRLLSKGADPNYFNPEKNNCPLHVAAAGGQSSQVELLVVYGADPGCVDANGKTPIDYARSEGYIDLAQRLVECQYELTDRLAYFVCGRKPDHRCNHHFIIPEMADRLVDFASDMGSRQQHNAANSLRRGVMMKQMQNHGLYPPNCPGQKCGLHNCSSTSLDISELAKEAKKMLQALPNNLFEELAMDVYDEVDRRENDEIWVSSNEQSSTINITIPFLPVNPEFSTTRNQGRQKLARFNPREFVTLIIDILSDAKRRQMGTASVAITPKEHKICDRNTYDSGLKISTKMIFSPAGRTSAVLSGQQRNSRGYSQVSSDDEPLYDSVASDEDYSSIDTQSIKSAKEEMKKDRPADSRIIHRETTPTSMVSFTESMTSEQVEGPVSTEDFLEMKKALSNSECRVQQLLQTQIDLKTEVNRLKTLVNSLVEENSLLKRDKCGNNNNNNNNNNPNMVTAATSTSMLNGLPQGRQNRQSATPPHSTIVTDLKRIPGTARPQSMFEPRDHQRLSRMTGVKNCMSSSPSPVHSNVASGGEDCDFENASNTSGSRKNSQGSDVHKSSLQSISEAAPLRKTPSAVFEEMAGDVIGLPTQAEVVKKTEKITKKIQELLQSAQEEKYESFAPCSLKIHAAVVDMASLFPKRLPKAESIRCALLLLTSSATRLTEECQECQLSHEQHQSFDPQLKTQQVIQSAFDIAKAAKQLVTLFQ
ncbi:GIT1 [Acanthosepion pharaonis]|uniref:GIT1 n=1 Tax=Acanthosepion pharaonis TaxID=158019 RepID=A0A812BLH1_ACAPH|nr:GIT1 [Sepia pharaonis]